MPYIQRDSTGRITGVSAEKTEAMAEWAEPDHAELKDYLARLAGAAHTPEVASALSESDQSLIRVVDDLVNVLVEKNLMRFTDLPEAAQKKLLERRSLRQSLTACSARTRSSTFRPSGGPSRAAGWPSASSRSPPSPRSSPT